MTHFRPKLGLNPERHMSQFFGQLAEAEDIPILEQQLTQASSKDQWGEESSFLDWL